MFDWIGGRLDDAWQTLRRTVIQPEPDPALDAKVAEAARARAVTIWLLGKVQSGKSSIVRVTTGSTAAEIGEGFKPCTRASKQFEFPADAPVLRFLDTRGLEEVGYDPAQDMAECATRTHLLMPVLRADDQATDALLAALGRIRAEHPEWPLVVAQTCLHKLYPHPPRHPATYPYTGTGFDDANPLIPPDLARSLARQRRDFAALPGSGAMRFVPLDFTVSQDGLSQDGLAPFDYGMPALADAIEALAPSAFAGILAGALRGGDDARQARARPHIYAYAAAAAAADVAPIVGVVGVPAVQAKLLHSLAAVYAVPWSATLATGLLGALGTGALVRQGGVFVVRELAKLIPGYGQTVGVAMAAAASFASTAALGEAACVFLRQRRAGIADKGEVAAAFNAALADAARLWRRRDTP